MIKRIILLALGLCTLGASASAQVKTLPILSLDEDMRASAMAGVQPMYSTHSTLYSGLSNLLYSQGEGFRFAYIVGIQTKQDAYRANYHQASVGYKLNRDNALSLGFRYLGGVDVPYVNEYGINKGTIAPRDWSVDLGYTRRLGDNWSVWSRAGYLQSYNSLTADVLTASVGVNYRKPLCCERGYMLGLSVENFGTKVAYTRSEVSYHQPTQGRLTASLMWDSFSLGGGARYDLGDHKFSFNLGGEWRPVQPLALRTGYTLSPYGNVWSTGAGFSFSGFGLDLAYNLHEYKEFSMLRIGLNCSI